MLGGINAVSVYVIYLSFEVQQEVIFKNICSCVQVCLYTITKKIIS